MADREKDPDTEAGQRERERELHRAQLEAVRAAFAAQGEGATPGAGGTDDAIRFEVLLARLRAELRRLDRRQRSAAWVAVVLVVSILLGAVALVDQMFFGRSYMLDEISARSVRADRIAVTRDLRILDAQGNELAVLGREPGAPGAKSTEGPVVLALSAQGEASRQLLRFAASKTGAGLTLEGPTGGSSVSLLSTGSGSTVEIRNGERTERLAGAEPEELPPVGAGPKTRGALLSGADEVPVWTPQREGPPNGDIPEVREVGHGFLVTDLSAHPAAEGVEVRGRMVNTTAVVHSGLAFKISLGDASATLTVPKISPGNSTGFRVTLPGAAPDRLGGAKIEYLGSTVAFQATSTEPSYGRQVEPK